jgi:hypothetical protein
MNVNQGKIVADVKSGLTDITWIAGMQRVIIACDSGKFF